MLLVAVSDEENQVTYEICLDKGFGCLAQCGLPQFLETSISKSFLKAYMPRTD